MGKRKSRRKIVAAARKWRERVPACEPAKVPAVGVPEVPCCGIAEVSPGIPEAGQKVPQDASQALQAVPRKAQEMPKNSKLACRKCGKKFKSSQNRREHERIVCKLPPRLTNSASSEYHTCMFAVITSGGVTRSDAAPDVPEEPIDVSSSPIAPSAARNAGSRPRKGKKTKIGGKRTAAESAASSEKDLQAPEDDEEEEKSGKISPLDTGGAGEGKKAVAFLRQYNKRVALRLVKCGQLACPTRGKLSFVAVLAHCFPPSFMPTTLRHHYSRVGKPNVSGQKKPKGIDLTQPDLDDRILEYRVKCLVNDTNAASIPVVVYGFGPESVPRVSGTSGPYFLYVDGAYLPSNFVPGRTAKIAAGLTATWALLDGEGAVVSQCGFNTSEYERVKIRERLNTLKPVYQEEFSRLKEICRKESNAPSSSTPRRKIFAVELEANCSHQHQIVKFPYDPYPGQVKIINCVVEACEKNANALIESPTGTGKTMALLSCLLSWTNLQPAGNRPTIFYLSPKHGQLAQVVDEIEKSAYHPVVVTLGSRKFMCPCFASLKKGDANEACKAAREDGSCDKIMVENPWLSDKICRRGSFGKVGEKEICPFYASRGMAAFADVVVMPYPYALDPFVRRTLPDLKFKDSIMVFDEAHNVAQAAEDALSDKITLKEVSECIADLEKIGPSTTIALERIKKIRTYLLDVRANLSAKDVMKALHETLFGGERTYDEFASGSGLANAACNSGSEAIKKISRFAFHIFEGIKIDAAAFAITITDALAARTIKIDCVDPSLALRQVVGLGVKSIIMMSGTLSPMRLFESELGIPFSAKLVAPHVLREGNVLSLTFSDPLSFDFSFRSMANNQPTIFEKLEALLAAILLVVPGGVLIFFTGYRHLEDFVSYSIHCGLLNTIRKTIFKETRTGIQKGDRQHAGLFENSSIDEYKRCSKNEGAILFAVCRGKISEGLNFPDEEARAVIVAGIPFSPMVEKLECKSRFYDGKKYCNDFSEWRRIDAMRAVNQCIGRAFRHSEDYGAVILLDKKFNEENISHLLPSWVCCNNCVTNIRQGSSKLAEFFRLKLKGQSLPCPHAPGTTELPDNEPVSMPGLKSMDEFCNWKKHYMFHTCERVKRRNFGQPKVKIEPDIECPIEKQLRDVEVTALNGPRDLEEIKVGQKDKIYNDYVMQMDEEVKLARPTKPAPELTTLSKSQKINAGKYSSYSLSLGMLLEDNHIHEEEHS